MTKSKTALTQTTPAIGVFPIVGIGASAGGLAAFEAFFSATPVDTGMAFVLVQHLAPNHKSILSDILRRNTAMSVVEVVDGVAVQQNCVYVIPPNSDMTLLNGSLHLQEPSEPHGHRLPIDSFFSSLAADQAKLAIGIVLSGTGSDGSQGVRTIKDGCGMVMAQSLESTEFDGMPSSAIATGVVDYVLAPADMPAQLIAYVAHGFGTLPPPASSPALNNEAALQKIFVLLRAQTGHDFSQYKPRTIYRRIERRMVVHQVETIDDYVKFLQQTSVEVEALFRDLLIGVTHFFRDPEAFEALENDIIPKLFADKPSGAVIRIWSTGCSTGEEAYSIAILLREYMEKHKQHFTVQVFATDIDSRAVATARAGIYPASIATHLQPERLARFFTEEPGGAAYRVNKGIRDLLIFSEQNVVKDPPFSRLDMICCRNLMIYLGSQLQKKLIPLFHYALKPGGMLFLGSSESIGEHDDLFSVLDRQAKLYQRKEDIQKTAHSATRHFSPQTTPIHAPHPKTVEKKVSLVKPPLREIAEQALLLHFAPASALVNSHGDILYLHGSAGMFLEPPAGEVGVSNILKMACEGLGRDLMISLHKAVSSKEIVRCPGLQVSAHGYASVVNLTIYPMPVNSAATSEVPLYLVALEAAALPKRKRRGKASAAQATDAVAEGRIEALNQELQARDEYLQAAQQELERSNGDLKSSNEEMQSINEELQSTNEELETSKEELQSVNEELATVNTELQTKVVDLSQSNNDMNNLLAGTGIATIFIDHQLRLLRFTPNASLITNLIQSDVGRLVSHIASNLIDYTGLIKDVQTVLSTLVPKEIDVQSVAGNWYTMRIQPYRTLDNVIEGAVITFVDVTDTVETRDALRKANEMFRLAVVVRDSHDAITVQDLDGRILAWNPGATKLYGWSEAEALQMNIRDLIPPKLREKALARVHQLSRAEILKPNHSQRILKNGNVVEVSMISTALLDKAGQMYAIATTERSRESTTAIQAKGANK